MVAWCEMGSSAADVDGVDATYEEPEGLDGFEVRWWAVVYKRPPRDSATARPDRPASPAPRFLRAQHHDRFDHVALLGVGVVDRVGGRLRLGDQTGLQFRLIRLGLRRRQQRLVVFAEVEARRVPRYTARAGVCPCVHLVARSLTRAQSSAQNRTSPPRPRLATRSAAVCHQPERPRRYRDPGVGVVAAAQATGGVLPSGVHADRYGSEGGVRFAVEAPTSEGSQTATQCISRRERRRQSLINEQCGGGGERPRREPRGPATKRTAQRAANWEV